MAPDTPCSNPFIIPADDGLGALLGLHPDPWDPLPISVSPTAGFNVHLLQTQISPRGHAWLWRSPSTETRNSWGLSCPGPTGGGGVNTQLPCRSGQTQRPKVGPRMLLRITVNLGLCPRSHLFSASPFPSARTHVSPSTPPLKHLPRMQPVTKGTSVPIKGSLTFPRHTELSRGRLQPGVTEDRLRAQVKSGVQRAKGSFAMC